MWSTRSYAGLKRKLDQLVGLLVIALVVLIILLALHIDYTLTYQAEASGQCTELVFEPGGRAKIASTYNATVYIKSPLVITTMRIQYDWRTNSTIYIFTVVNPSTDQQIIRFSGPVTVLESSHVKEIHTVSLVKTSLALDIFMIIFAYILKRTTS